jgi:hypothetical protein
VCTFSLHIEGGSLIPSLLAWALGRSSVLLPYASTCHFGLSRIWFILRRNGL